MDASVGGTTITTVTRRPPRIGVGQRLEMLKMKEMDRNSSRFNNLSVDPSHRSYDSGPSSVTINGKHHNQIVRRSPVSAKLQESSLYMNGYSAYSPCSYYQKPLPNLDKFDTNLVRIIAQYLRGLGLNESVESLMIETGCKLENGYAVRLRNALLKENYTLALEILEQSYTMIANEHIDAGKLMIKEQQFYNLVRRGAVDEALWLIRDNIWELPLESAKREIYMLRMFMSDQELLDDERNLHSSEKRRYALVDRVQTVLPYNYMLPSNRLRKLVDQAYANQRSRCPIHAMSKEKPRMKADCVMIDHQCDELQARINREDPEVVEALSSQCLKDHPSPVWCVEFSPNGLYLATGSRLACIDIWKINPNTYRASLSKRLLHTDHSYKLGKMCWSNNAKYLAVCGRQEDPFELVVFNVILGVPHRTIRASNHLARAILTTCSFINTMRSILVSGNEHGTLQMHDMELTREPMLMQIEGLRLVDVYGLKDCNTIIVVDTLSRVRKFKMTGEPREETLFIEETAIKSLIMHPKERYMLLSTMQCLRLWDLQTKTLVRNFSGANHGTFLINACFGGPKKGYIATGTADGGVIVWQVDCSLPLVKLDGHTASVNCVAWNPKFPRVIASASDDKTARVSVLPRIKVLEKNYHGFPSKQQEEDDNGIPQELHIKLANMSFPQPSNSTSFESDSMFKKKTGPLSPKVIWADDSSEKNLLHYNNHLNISSDEDEDETSSSSYWDSEIDVESVPKTTGDSYLFLMQTAAPVTRTVYEPVYTETINGKTNGYYREAKMTLCPIVVEMMCEQEHAVDLSDPSSAKQQVSPSIPSDFNVFPMNSCGIGFPDPVIEHTEETLRIARLDIAKRKAAFRQKAAMLRKNHNEKYRHIRNNRNRMEKSLAPVPNLDDLIDPPPNTMFCYSSPPPLGRIPLPDEMHTLLLHTPVPYRSPEPSAKHVPMKRPTKF